MSTRRRRPPSRLSRFLAPALWGAVALAAAAAVGAPLDTDPGLSPFSLTVSDFAALDRGGLIETSMAVLGVMSFVLLAVGRRWLTGVRGLPSVLLAAWGLGLVVAAVVPTDPLTTHLSGSAYVHRYASIMAFLALPLAGIVLARRLAAAPDAGRTIRWLRLLSTAALAGAVVMALSAGPGHRELIGLVERVLLGSEVVLLGVFGHYVQRRMPLAARTSDGWPGEQAGRKPIGQG
ncbi:DUF998 domain-containing protein [Streptomyces sp. NPDC057694]|uniref:DUF998 domain-containing protein n=1 Tax=Streptomyces sp. NPDC057694 TaxID=3346216 RepID=UPI0036B28EBC